MHGQKLSEIMPKVQAGAHERKECASRKPTDEEMRHANEQVAKDMEDGAFPKLHRLSHLSGQTNETSFRPWSRSWIEKLGLLNAKLRNPGSIIALVGPRGTGKTQMATDAAFGFSSDLFIRRRLSRVCRYVRAMEFFMAVKDSYNASTSERDAFEPFTRPRLLVLDEVQVRNDSKWEDNALTFLLDTRYGACNRTVVISNQTDDEFIDSIGESVASRISETGLIIRCDWESFRK